MDQGIVGTRKKVVRKFAGHGFDSTDNGRRAEIIARRYALDLAHVAILAGFSPCSCWGCPVFTERFFESKTVEQCHVVAGATKHGFRDIGKLLDPLVDLASGFFRISNHPVFVCVVEDSLHFGVAHGAEDNLRQSSFDKRQSTAYLIVTFVEPMADYACDAFA